MPTTSTDEFGTDESIWLQTAGRKVKNTDSPTKSGFFYSKIVSANLTDKHKHGTIPLVLYTNTLKEGPMQRQFKEALGVLLFFFTLLISGSPKAKPAEKKTNICEKKSCKEKPAKKKTIDQEWGFGVSHTGQCQYTPAGSCPYTSWGLVGFTRSTKYPLLFSGGAAISNPIRWMDGDGKRRKRTIIDAYLNIGYRLQLFHTNDGSLLASMTLHVGAGLGLRLRVLLDTVTHNVLGTNVDVPDIKGTLQPYGQVWLLAEFSHAFMLLSADIRDTASLTLAFGVGF
jgi:hypothetical protein